VEVDRRNLRGFKGLRSFGAIMGLLSLPFLAGCGRGKIERVEWTTMGTVAAVQVRGLNAPVYARLGCDQAKRVAAEIEKRLNAHDPESELRRLAPLPEDEILARCDACVSNCYAAAFRLMRETGGAFNPRWRGPKTLDLGAIAKGFALDVAQAQTYIGDNGQSGLLDLGGNLKSVRGEWKVGIAESDIVIMLTNGMACATSAEYFRGKHIRDGRTGAVVTNGVYSVTVVHPTSAMLADGLSTTLFVLGKDEGEEFLKKFYPEAKAYWVMK